MFSLASERSLVLGCGVTFYLVLWVFVLLSVAIIFVGMAIVGAGRRIATAIFPVAGLLEAIRDRKP